MSDHTVGIGRLSDAALLSEVTRLADAERGATAELIAYLAELDSRRLYLGAGFSSLFAYCTVRLSLSEHEAYNRIDAARAARRFPLVLELLRCGRVNLTTIRLLAPHLTADNHRRLLEAAEGKSRLEVEELVVRFFPKPDVRSTVRKLPAPTLVAAPLAATVGEPEASPAATELERVADRAESGVPPTTTFASLAPFSAPPHRTARGAVVPLAADRYKVSFTASAETWQKLRQARELLRHRVPDGDFGDIVDQALTLLLEQLTKRKFAAVTRPRRPNLRLGPESTAGGSMAGESAAGDSLPARSHTPSGVKTPCAGRHISAEVRRAVWKRDAGCCAFVGHERRCGEHGRLEFHHLQPYAAEGPPTAANISLRCQAHNAYEARLYFSEIRNAASGMPTGHAP